MSKKLKELDIDDALYEMQTDPQIEAWICPKKIGLGKLLKLLDSMELSVTVKTPHVEFIVEDDLTEEQYLLRYDIEDKTIDMSRLRTESKTDNVQEEKLIPIVSMYETAISVGTGLAGGKVLGYVVPISDELIHETNATVCVCYIASEFTNKQTGDIIRIKHDEQAYRIVSINKQE